MTLKMDTGTLVKKIIAEIQSGKLMDDQRKLPTEPELMEHYQVTRYTLRESLKRLSMMGYIYQVHGVGNFVRQQQTSNSVSLEHNGGLSAEMARIGRNLTTKKAVEKNIFAKDAEFLPDTFNFDNDTKLIEITRFRNLDNEPYVMEHSYYLQSVIEKIPEKALYGSLFEYFEEQSKIQIGFIDQTIMSEPLPESVSDFMKLPKGSPSLVVQDESYLNTGQLLAFSKQYYNYKLAKMFMVKKIH
ncbi:GntR family transcriptional regulator [Companilactobacillus huachuanensis]|uniref:GntR family transcriptional regulator n=1 Tax=Companilactobacillus huachuanensis TaxID=2559914 RepID=A0ABW1RMU6_9LACO|nr:GntR family transcriptional regulator [Companilactobacillus huachuanensis]